MGPKKSTLKGKNIAEDDKSGSSWQGGALKAAFLEFRISTNAVLRRIRHMSATKTKEWGVTSIQPANAFEKVEATFCPIFLHTVFARLVPPSLSSS